MRLLPNIRLLYIKKPGFSSLRLWVTGVVTTPFGSLLFKSLGGTAIILGGRVVYHEAWPVRRKHGTRPWARQQIFQTITVFHDVNSVPYFWEVVVTIDQAINKLS